MIVEYKRENTYTAHTKTGDSFTFIPGTNMVPTKLWNDLQQNDHFKSDVTKGMFKVVTDNEATRVPVNNAPAAEDDTAPALAGVDDVEESIRVVKATNDMTTLRELKRNETRREVAEAIDVQMEKLRANRGRARNAQGDGDNG